MQVIAKHNHVISIRNYVIANSRTARSHSEPRLSHCEPQPAHCQTQLSSILSSATAITASSCHCEPCLWHREPLEHAIAIRHYRDYEDRDAGLKRRRLVGVADSALDAAQPRPRLGGLPRAAGQVGDGLDDGPALGVRGGLEVVGSAVAGRRRGGGGGGSGRARKDAGILLNSAWEGILLLRMATVGTDMGAGSRGKVDGGRRGGKDVQGGR